MNTDVHSEQLPAPREESLLERVVKVSAFLVSAVPGVGGPGSEALGFWLQEQEKERWRSYWAGLEDRVRSLDLNKLDIQFLQSREFILRLQDIHSEVTRAADDEKLEYLRNFLLSCLWTRGPDVEWRNLVWQHVRRMSGAHLSLLECFFNRQHRLSHVQRFNLPQPGDHAPLGLKDCVTAFPRFDQNLLQMLLADLESFCLIAPWRPETFPTEGWSLTNAGMAVMGFLKCQWGGSTSENN